MRMRMMWNEIPSQVKLQKGYETNGSLFDVSKCKKIVILLSIYELHFWDRRKVLYEKV